MIFVTVGTHEQQFDRLIKEVDRLRRNEDIAEDVIAQIGFSTYEPESCQWSRLFPYEKMCEYVAEARIVITHGGPSSFLAPLQIGKVPIVVPRQKRFGEHVNDHQVEFCRAVKERMGNIILVEDVRRLPNAIDRYEEYRKERKLEGMNHNKFFNEQLEAIVRGLDV
jgi:UDP-N-acetylglucosamine transferase subunit ALG13